MNIGKEEIIGIIIGITKQLAGEKIKSRPMIQHSLREIDWNITGGVQPSQNTIARWNLDLDERGCLGRVAQASAIVARQFPATSPLYAEVWEDALRNKILKILRIVTQGQKPTAGITELLEDILTYEEPHAVLMIGHHQYDPLSGKLGRDIRHPHVKLFPLWEAIAAARLVSEAYLTKNAAKKFTLLRQAEEICPGTMLVAENKIAALWMARQESNAIRSLRRILEKRPTARCLWALWFLTRDKKYIDRLNSTYTPLMAELLKKEMESYE